MVTKKPKGVFSLPLCSSDWSFLFAVGLKTYLISGQKVKEPQCSCSQALLPGLESADGARTPGTSAADSASDPSKANKQGEKPKVSCAPTAGLGKPYGLVYALLYIFTYAWVCVHRVTKQSLREERFTKLNGSLPAWQTIPKIR